MSLIIIKRKLLTIFFSFSSGNLNPVELRNDFNKSLASKSSVCYHKQLKNNKVQNYYPFRCAEYHKLTNDFNKSKPLNRKQTNYPMSYSNRPYVRNNSSMDNEQNTQEYCRYRDASLSTTPKVCFLFLLVV